MNKKKPLAGPAPIDPAWYAGSGHLELPSYAFTPVSTRALRSFAAATALPKVSTIIAPPGYGKTVLMVQLREFALKQGTTCFWIGLDDRAADLPKLLTLIELGVGLDRQDKAMSTVDDPRGNILGRIDNLVAHLTWLPGQTALFIDNLNSCTDPALARLIDALVFRTPASTQIVMTSTMPIPFDVARARIEMKLRRITPQELCFDHRATAAVLRAAGLTSADDSVVGAVQSKTEGWPVAVRLIQLIMTEQINGERDIESFSGADADLAALLSRRLMAAFDKDLRTFLLEISEFRIFSADLAGAATGNRRAGEWIRFLIERNVLIVPVDKSNTWFRFHGLFRQFLLGEAAREEIPERRLEIMSKGVAWLCDVGDLVYALELALRAPLPVQVTEILEDVAQPMVRERGDLSSFTHFVEQARTLHVDLGTEALFWCTWALVFTRQYENAMTTLDQLGAKLTKDDASPSRVSPAWARHRMAENVVNFHLDRLEVYRRDTPRWLDDFPDANPFEYAIMAGGLAIARADAHDFAGARRAFRIAQDSIVKSHSDYGNSWISSVGAIVNLMQGDPAEAERQLSEAETRVRTNLGDGAAVLGVLALERARAAADMGRMEEAIRFVSFGMEAGVNNGILDIAWFGLEVALDAMPTGRGPFDLPQLQAIALRYPYRLTHLVELWLVRHALREGRLNDAIEKAEGLGIWTKTGLYHDDQATVTAMERTAMRLAGIDLLMATGNLRKAGLLLETELPRAGEDGRLREQVELHIMQAELRMRSGHPETAIKSLTNAIVAAARRQLLRPFLTHLDLVAQLIQVTPTKRFCLTQARDIAFMNELRAMCSLDNTLRARPHGEGRQIEDPETGSLSRPTPREIALLRLLDSGLDNSEIAADLSLSLATVKWHLNKLYSKLGVKNRAGAVAKARALRIINR